MTLQAQERPGGLRVLHATGELDVVSVPPLLPTVPGLVAGAAGVVLDLGGVVFLDSSGVRLVDRLARECGATGTAFRVSAPRGAPARRVLELVGMAAVLGADDVATALAELPTCPGVPPPGARAS